MLEILAIIAGKVLSLPGILGLALGMMTRKPVIGALLGALVGVAESVVFADFVMANIHALDLGIGVLVGALAGGLGSLIRIRGATV